MSRLNAVTIFILAILLTTSCAPAQPGSSGAGQPSSSTAPQRISMVLLGDPGYFSQAAYRGQGRIPGIGSSAALTTSGLTSTNAQGAVVPMLGTAVPSTNDGSWRVFADGTMETTSTLKRNTFWHDGTRLTSGDLAFSVRTYMDREAGMPRSSTAISSISGADAIDSSSVVVHWSAPFINADTIFGSGETPSATLVYILPQHILETPVSNRVDLLDLPYWREEFIGTGPFKLEQYVPNSSASFDAFDQYVLGRPHIDQIELKFISDPNTVIANVLAGSLDLVMGGIVSFDQAADVTDRWPAGHMTHASGNSISIYTQFMDASPAVVTDPQFRRALLTAMDRQAILDSFQRGQGAVSHLTVFSPTSAEFASIQNSIVKYPFDPARAAGMIEALGYARGADGLYHSSPSPQPSPARGEGVIASPQPSPARGEGEPLSIEMRTITREPQSKMVFAIADNWKQVGVDTQTYIIPDQQASDSQYRATFPAFQLLQQNTSFDQFHSANIPLPTNRYIGVNKGRIADPGLTALIDRYSVTIPWDERMQIAGQLIHRISDEVMYMPTIYRAEAALIANRVKNVEGINYSGNAYEWTLA